MKVLLQRLGAEVSGLSLRPDTDPNLFDQLGLVADGMGEFGDIRDPSVSRARVAEVQPDIVFHMAAQSLVLRGYAKPHETWDTNVMGTVNLLEAIRHSGRPTIVVCITTDKVYENKERDQSYVETDRLGGHDPYSASKAASELVIDSYRRSFFAEGEVVRLASARAGNVVGGGDWAENRIIPDLVRALLASRSLEVRNPGATRPWQHVLDPLNGYLMLAEALVTGQENVQSAFNFGPDDTAQRPVRDVVEASFIHWSGAWSDTSDRGALHEARRLALNTDKAHGRLNWAARWGFETTIEQTIKWYRAVSAGGDPVQITHDQISKFLEPVA